jgi:hypothetical protein
MGERVKTAIFKRVALDPFGAGQPVAQVCGHFEVLWILWITNVNECKKQGLGILYLNPFPHLAPPFLLTKAVLCAFRILQSRPPCGPPHHCHCTKSLSLVSGALAHIFGKPSFLRKKGGPLGGQCPLLWSWILLWGELLTETAVFPPRLDSCSA